MHNISDNDFTSIFKWPMGKQNPTVLGPLVKLVSTHLDHTSPASSDWKTDVEQTSKLHGFN
jgi:hypothetical protein